jgi:hypothetical protein
LGLTSQRIACYQLTPKRTAASSIVGPERVVSLSPCS